MIVGWLFLEGLALLALHILLRIIKTLNELVHKLQNLAERLLATAKELEREYWTACTGDR